MQASYILYDDRKDHKENEKRRDQAQAEFEHGVLTLTLPKAEEMRPKTVTVKAG